MRPKTNEELDQMHNEVATRAIEEINLLFKKIGEHPILKMVVCMKLSGCKDTELVNRYYSRHSDTIDEKEGFVAFLEEVKFVTYVHSSENEKIQLPKSNVIFMKDNNKTMETKQ